MLCMKDIEMQKIHCNCLCFYSLHRSFGSSRVNEHIISYFYNEHMVKDVCDIQVMSP